MNKTNYGVSISSVGHYVPKKIETNEELCKSLNIDPSWIIEKTGIKRRYKVEQDQSCSDIATFASNMAIDKIGINIEEIDLIIVCTFSGDYIFPPVSAKVQNNIKAINAQIFDLQANCCGFVTGLTVASDRMLVDPDVQNSLVIGAEVNSKYLDIRDINSSIYMSDGAGAVILSKTEKDLGILGSFFYTDSSNYEAVRMRGGGSSYRKALENPNDQAYFMEMNGIATWKQAITHLPRVIKRACEKSNISLEEIDVVIFHQANLNMIEYIVKKLGLGMKKTYINVSEIGNTGAASVGIALSEAVDKNFIQKGQLVLIAAVGAGFNFGASVWRWDK